MIIFLKRNSGAVFLWSMIMVGLLGIMSGALAVVVSRDLFTAQYLKHSSQAFLLADAGINHAFSQLKADFNDTNCISKSNISLGTSTGSYAVAFSTHGTNKVATSTGTVAGVTRTVVAEFSGPAVYESLNYAVFANRDIYGEGDVSIYGDMFANRNILLETLFPWDNIEVEAYSGRTGSVDAYNSTPVTHAWGGTITADGGFHKAGAAIQFPTLNFEYYRNLAQNGGLYYSSSRDWRSVNLNPGNGVIYVNGNVTFGGLFRTNRITGCLVVNGYIFVGLTNTVIQTKKAGYTNLPAILAQGDIFGTSRLNYNGLVYSRGGSVVVIIANGTGCMMASRDVYIIELLGHLNAIWSPENPPDLQPSPVGMVAWSE